MGGERNPIKATARRSGPGIWTHQIDIRDHQLVVDEPVAMGGSDAGPAPQELLAASLASCTAVTLEMYAERKGWDLQEIAVSVEFNAPERDQPTRFKMTLELPAGCTEEQLERLRAIAGKCPVHRVLEGEVLFEYAVTTG